MDHQGAQAPGRADSEHNRQDHGQGQVDRDSPNLLSRYHAPRQCTPTHDTTQQR